MGLKVLSRNQFILSHVLLVGGLILFSVGPALHITALIFAGIWFFAGGMCVAFSSAFAKLAAK